MPRLRRTLPVLALLAFYYALNHFGMAQLSRTFDEPVHLRYGLRVAMGNSDRFDDSKMPFSALNAIPLRLNGIDEAQLLGSGDVDALVAAARPVTLVAGVVLGLVVFGWAAEMYGYAAGLLALMLYVLEPNLAAHAQLVTTDCYAALSVALAFYALWRLLAAPSRGRLAASALALAVAQTAKYSATYLYPLFLVLGLLWLRRQPARRAAWRALLGAAVVYGVVSLLVINAGFLFNGSFSRWGAYDFKSDAFRTLQAATPALAALPVPLPYPYLQGLDWVKHNDERGSGIGRVYLLGETRQGRGFLSYYLVAFVFKTPLALQLLLLWALVDCWRHRAARDLMRNELVLAVPIAFFAVYFSAFYKIQIGLRFLLVIYPLLLIFTAGLVRGWPEVTPRRRAVLAVLLAWMAVSNLSYFGHNLAYFNELIGPRINAYRVLADSNLDWGQHRGALHAFLKAHPDFTYRPAEPAPGRFIVNANAVTGVALEPAGHWLSAFEPIDHFEYEYLIYEISTADLGRLPAGDARE